MLLDPDHYEDEFLELSRAVREDVSIFTNAADTSVWYS